MTHLDLPPITAFALEGSGPAALALGAAQTLTVPAMSRSQRLESGLAASIRLGAPADSKRWPLRVAIQAGQESTLTLTF